MNKAENIIHTKYYSKYSNSSSIYNLISRYEQKEVYKSIVNISLINNKFSYNRNIGDLIAILGSIDFVSGSVDPFININRIHNDKGGLIIKINAFLKRYYMHLLGVFMII